MDQLLRKILDTPGVSGYEGDIAAVMAAELKKCCDEVTTDHFGNVIARKGKGKKKVMLAAHMDEIGLIVKHIGKEGYVSFIKVGGIDDRILVSQRVVIKGRKGEVFGIIGSKPPHLLREEERKQGLKYDDMFIDIGARSREEAEKLVALGDPAVFLSGSGMLNDRFVYGKAVDNRAGCYALIKVMQQLKNPKAQVYAVATCQEEVGLKGARTSAFRIAPDLAIALDTTVAGDTPQIKEKESALKLGAGVAITLIEASGRGLIVSEKIKNLFIDTAKRNRIKHQVDIIDGGMTDGAMIYLNREGVPTGTLAIPSRYIHSPTGVFSLDDLEAAVSLTVKILGEFS
jgi:tetrahedral aminopeptidase